MRNNISTKDTGTLRKSSLSLQIDMPLYEEAHKFSITHLRNLYGVVYHKTRPHDPSKGKILRWLPKDFDKARHLMDAWKWMKDDCFYSWVLIFQFLLITTGPRTDGGTIHSIRSLRAPNISKNKCLIPLQAPHPFNMQLSTSNTI